MEECFSQDLVSKIKQQKKLKYMHASLRLTETRERCWDTRHGKSEVAECGASQGGSTAFHA
jgi:hypothetical protein